MDDTILNLSFGEHRLNGCGKAGEIVSAGNQDILYAPVSQAIQDRSPELGAFIFAYPHTQNVLFSIQIDPNGNVDSFLDDLPFAAHMVMDGIQEYHRIDALQRPLLPFLCDGKNLICDAAYRCI